MSKTKSDCMNSNRYDLIEALKFIAIILVVFGHALTFYLQKTTEEFWVLESIEVMIYSVHVPLFFVLAGFLIHKQSLNIFYIKKMKRLLIPFLFFSSLKLFYSNIISTEYIYGATFIAQLIDAFFYGGAYWFPLCLLIIYFIYPTIWQVSIKNKVAILLITVIINIVFRNILGIKITDFLQINAIIFHLPYVIIGNLIAEVKYDNYKLRRSFLIVTIMIGFSFLLSILIMNDYLPYLNYFIKLVLSFIEMIVLLELAKNILILNPQPVIHLLSKFSLQIMFLDSFYKVILFHIFNQFFQITLTIVIIITILNLFLSSITAFLAERYSILSVLFGLIRFKSEKIILKKAT